MDLADTSEANALAELERILDKMSEALGVMKRAEKLESSIRFLNSQYRDGKMQMNFIFFTVTVFFFL